MLPNERQENRILLVYGIYTQGSQAAIEFITSRAGLQSLRKALVGESGGELPPEYFESLLEDNRGKLGARANLNRRRPDDPRRLSAPPRFYLAPPTRRPESSDLTAPEIHSIAPIDGGRFLGSG